MKLKSWNPTSGEVTNGLVIEVEENFGREARSILCDKIFDILGIHKSQFLKCRFSKYIARTSSKLVKEGKLLESSWLYLEKLDSGLSLTTSHIKSVSPFNLMDLGNFVLNVEKRPTFAAGSVFQFSIVLHPVKKIVG